DRPSGAVAARSRAAVRASGWGHLPRRAELESAVFSPPDAWPCRLPLAPEGPLSLRIGQPPRRRRHRRTWPQCRAGHPGRPSRAVRLRTGWGQACATRVERRAAYGCGQLRHPCGRLGDALWKLLGITLCTATRKNRARRPGSFESAASRADYFNEVLMESNLPL